jgi:hypothetical protein
VANGTEAPNVQGRINVGFFFIVHGLRIELSIPSRALAKRIAAIPVHGNPIAAKIFPALIGGSFLALRWQRYENMAE